MYRTRSHEKYYDCLLTAQQHIDTPSYIFEARTLYCIASIHLYGASCSAHQSEALPVRETQREESSLERTKRGTWLTSYFATRHTLQLLQCFPYSTDIQNSYSERI